MGQGQFAFLAEAGYFANFRLTQRITLWAGYEAWYVYGIAIDIEPDRNTCCGCVAPWNEHALCKQKNKTVWERMAMPRSWVETFEKYGFYWLGHDVLQDTMHFEFLGDPDKITEAPTSVAQTN